MPVGPHRNKKAPEATHSPRRYYTPVIMNPAGPEHQSLKVAPWGRVVKAYARGLWVA